MMGQREQMSELDGIWSSKQNLIDDLIGSIQTTEETEVNIAEEPENLKNLEEEVFKKEIPDENGINCAAIHIMLSDDLMSAKISISPLQEGERNITEKDIRNKLREHGIEKGIKEDYIYRLAHYTVYDRPFKIAQGVPPMAGEDAKVDYQFDLMAEPTVFHNEEDYEKLYFVRVKKGDLLCETHPVTTGFSGWNILGETIEPTAGIGMSDIVGSNTVDIGNQLYAGCDGLVSVSNGTINVYSTQSVEFLENESLEFEGTILVEGDVSNNAVIKAQGDIIVKGSVQNSQLFAGGNIVICKGVTGKGSFIKSEGYLRSYFIENAEVEVGTDITTDVVMCSNIICGGTLRLTDKRGNLIGGTCYAGGNIFANNIGNNAGIPTKIFLTQKNPDVANNLHDVKIVARGKMYPNVNLAIDHAQMKNENVKSYCVIEKGHGGLVLRAITEGDESKCHY